MGKTLRGQAPVSGTIETLREDGLGYMEMADQAYLVADVLPGEQVTVLPERRSKGLVHARVLSVTRASPDRVTAQCPVFGTCGGCRLQHMAPAAQRQWKQQALLDGLARQGIRPGRVLEPVVAEPWGYRRRARLGVRFVPAKGRVLVGFRERGKPYIADMQGCEVLSPAIAELLRPLSELIGGLSISQALPQVEVSQGDAAMALVFRVLEPPSGEDLLALEAFGRRSGADIYLQDGGPDTLRPLCPAPATLEYSLPDFDVSLAFEPADFIQVNPGINRAMVRRAVELLDCAGRTVLDLFCGLGNFSLPLARRAAQVTGVDADPGLILRAQANARRNGLENVSFQAGDLYQEPVSGQWMQGSYQRVLLDPPRTGAARVLPLLPALGAERLVYVSCDPASFLRDAAELVHRFGYTLEAVGIMDMFPHTLHVETLGVFRANWA